MPINSTRRSSMPACRLSGRRLPLKRLETGRQGIYLPTRIDQFRVHGRPGAHLWSHARLQAAGGGCHHGRGAAPR